MSKPIVLILCDGPSDPDPETGRRRYEGGYLSKLAERLGALVFDHGADLRVIAASDLVVVGHQPRSDGDKALIEEARASCKTVLYNAECLEAWMRDRTLSHSKCGE